LNSKKNNLTLIPVNNGEACTVDAPERPERRHGDRRREVLRALIHGSLNPRRRIPRRAGERAVSAVDWHAPQWLAIALLILMFSCSDAFLTLLLLERGAHEANPLMAPLLGHPAAAFALVKIGLTAAGVVLLTQLARLRAFGGVPIGALLYVVLALYGLLMVYELGLLNRL
jgi:hypothetical protein